jgi:hypothetical protein
MLGYNSNCAWSVDTCCTPWIRFAGQHEPSLAAIVAPQVANNMKLSFRHVTVEKKKRNIVVQPQKLSMLCFLRDGIIARQA